jgi:hypothetical protein
MTWCKFPFLNVSSCYNVGLDRGFPASCQLQIVFREKSSGTFCSQLHINLQLSVQQIEEDFTSSTSMEQRPYFIYLIQFVYQRCR